MKTIAAAPFALGSLTDVEAYAQSLPNSERMPALFLGHGSPMNAIEENEFVKNFREVEKSIATPKAILCISAHWFTQGTKVTAMEMPQTIHDFGGFPRELYDVQYPAPGHPELAAQTGKLLAPTTVELDQKWGLDHGAWSVIKHLYPNADIPVVQLSVDRTQPPEYHYQLGRKLDSLRDRGILIIGSGNIVHNLRTLDGRNLDKVNHGFDWAFEAQAFVNQYIVSGNHQPLLEYQRQGRAIQMSVPTPEHYLPLLYILGMRHQQQDVSLFNDKLVGGSISMTSVKIV